MVDDPNAGDRPAGPTRRSGVVRRPTILKPRKARASSPDTSTPGQRRRRRRRWQITEAGVALVALLVSASAFLVNGAMYLRGPEIVAIQPEHILLYRNSGPRDSVLVVAMPVGLINAASSDYGDVASRASLSLPGRSGARFPYGALVEPVQVPGRSVETMSREVERAIVNCPTGARCIPATGFYAIERPRQLLDVPGGSSRNSYLGFLISTFECERDATCTGFDNYAQALSVLRRPGLLSFRVELDFQFDRRHRLECEIDTRYASAADVLEYLDEKGWAMPACVRNSDR